MHGKGDIIIPLCRFPIRIPSVSKVKILYAGQICGQPLLTPAAAVLSQPAVYQYPEKEPVII